MTLSARCRSPSSSAVVAWDIADPASLVISTRCSEILSRSSWKELRMSPLSYAAPTRIPSRGSHCRFTVRRRGVSTVSYTHLRAHETRHDLVCRLLLEKQ